MSRTGDMKIVILFEDEIRAAARALHALQAKSSGDAGKVPDDEYHRLFKTALEACFAALYHVGLVENGKAHVTIASKRLISLAADDDPHGKQP